MYFGRAGDLPILGGVGQRLYDYIIHPGDGNDLAAGLESSVYGSVFIPRGVYAVTRDIRVNGVSLISGAGRDNTRITLDDDCHLILETAGGVTLENFSVENGGEGGAQIQANSPAGPTSISNVTALSGAGDGFRGIGAAADVSFANCQAIGAAGAGFRRFTGNSGFVNCVARDCGGKGGRLGRGRVQRRRHQEGARYSSSASRRAARTISGERENRETG